MPDFGGFLKNPSIFGPVGMKWVGMAGSSVDGTNIKRKKPNDSVAMHTYRLTMITNFLASTDEWKKQLAECLIDYDSLDIKGTIASGV